jgi:hypothetical protein
VKRTGKYVPPRCVRSTTSYSQSSRNFKKSISAKSNRRLKSALGTQKKCPKGQILRKPYVRRFTTATRTQGYIVKRGNKTYKVFPKKLSTLVKASCIKDRGLPGSVSSSSSIGPLRRGDLSKYGYNVKLSESQRHSSLEKAIKEYGALGVYRKLDAVAKLSVRTAPDASKIFKIDRDWVQRKHELKAF